MTGENRLFRLVRKYLYATALSIALAINYFYLYHGWSLRWMLGFEIVLFLTLLFLERKMPFIKDLTAAKSQRHVDFSHLLFFLFFFAYPGLGNEVVRFAITTTHRLFDILRLSLPLTPATQNLKPWLAFLLAIPVGEFGTYWCHRLLLHSKYWPAHRCHHSSPGVYVMMSFRQHLLDTGVVNFSQIMIQIMFGFNFETVVASGLFIYVCAQLGHCNVDYDNPWIGKVLLTNNVHRIHHTNDPVGSNSNFGVSLLVWDHLFGTYTTKYPSVVEYGLSDVDGYPTNRFWAQVFDPLLPRSFKSKVFGRP
jgi:sterol desaturase/sphingolipid hydroxylase (fatty acid hydroxylase superfamily)